MRIRRYSGQREFFMLDLLCILVTVAFFELSIAFTRGCERL